MRRTSLMALLLISLAAPACTQITRKGETARYDTVVVDGYNVRDTLARLRVEITVANDSLAALRASLALVKDSVTEGAQASLTDSAAALRIRDTNLVNSLARTLARRIASDTVIVQNMNVADSLGALKTRIASILSGTYAVAQAALAASASSVAWSGVSGVPPVVTHVADTTAALRVQLNQALAQAAAYRDSLARFRTVDSTHSALLASRADSIEELQAEVTAEKLSTISRFAVATDSITALRTRLAALQTLVDSGGVSTPTVIDLIAPVPITDLVATGGENAALSFTSPNAVPGTAAAYDIRYSTQTITEYGDSSGASAISVDSVKYTEQTNVTTVQLTMVNDGTANDMFVAAVGGYDWAAWYLDSVKSDRDGAFTLAGEAVRFDMHAAIWTLDEPTAGNHTVTFYFRNTPRVVCGLYRLSHVASIRTTVTNTGVAWPTSFVTVPSSVTGELIIDAHSLDPDLTGGTWGSGQTGAWADYANDEIDACGASSYRDGVSGNVDMTFDYGSTGEDFAVVAVALSAVTGGSASTAWALATQYQNEPAPKAAGSAESITLGGLPSDTYYFAVKATDSKGNISALSNIDSAVVAGSTYTPPDTTEWRGGYGTAYGDSITSGTVWVDSAAALGGDGSAGAPFKTIASGIAAAASGDTVIVKRGTYPETINAKSGVFLTSYAKQAVRVSGNPTGVLRFLVASGVSNFTVQGIDFAVARIYHQSEYHVDVTGSTGVTIRYSNIRQELEDCTSSPFQFDVDLRAVAVDQWSQHFTLAGCYLTGWSYTLVLTANASDTSFFWVKNNHFAKQSWCAIVVGWPTAAAGFHTPAVLIENNLIENSWGEDGIQWQPYYGTAAEQATPRHFKHLVRNNVFRDLAENGLDFKATGHIRVEDNYFYRVSGVDDGWFKNGGKSGGAFEVGAGDTSKNVIATRNVFYSNPGSTGSQFWPGWKLFHNTMVNNRRGLAGDTTNDCANISHWGVLYGNAIKNNVMVNNYVYVQSSAASAALDIDYNVYYQTSGVPLFSYYASGWVEVSGLAQWRAHFSSSVAGREAHSRTVDPQFENVPAYPTENHTSYDFRPAAGSPLIDSAGALTVTTNAATGTAITVADAWYFRDALGMSAMGVTGDSVQIASAAPVGILAVDYTTNTLTLSESRTWSAADGVWIYRRGKRVDDCGAIQR